MTRQHRLNLESLLPTSGRGSADGEPLVAPIVQSTTFCRDGIASEAAHAYSRQSNPTVAALERALGALEEAPPAVCYSTGLAAETALFLTVLRAGDHVVCSEALYGGTTRLLEQVFTGPGVETDFVDTTDVEAVRAALRPNTALVFLETPSNPTLAITDVRAVARLARARGALVAVDNTFLTPLLQQPLDLGADVSVYSTTKFVEGHSAALGGALVARDEALLERLRFVRTASGGIQTPFHAWLTLQGVKTLGVRLERQCASASAIAERLAARPDVRRVHYPGLDAGPARETAERQHLGAHGAVLSFEVDGGLERAKNVALGVRVPRLVEHVGGLESLLTHSATMTHGGVSREHRERVGVTDGLLRLSVGIEPGEAIFDDLERALDAASLRQESSHKGPSSQQEVSTCSAV
ncbi:MAG: aminotransferase class I/II-fold pyridoxal phosphate-dependent enzyme [Planctomycetota bacterium]